MLLIVLVVVMLATMVAASLLFVLGAEHVAAAAGERGEQSWTTAMSGVYQGLRVASEAAPGSLDWQDNPAVFQEQLVCDDGAQRWYFSVYSVPPGGGIRYGITDEASKLNIYHSTAAMLEALPNMTPPLVENLFGALGSNGSNIVGPEDMESNSVPMTNLPILSVSQPWSCLDELLNVSGFDLGLLYGDYTNLSGRLDPEDSTSFATDFSTGSDALSSQSSAGLSQFLTVCTYDLNQDNNGQPRVNLNQPDADLSKLNLPQSALAYIEALQRNHQSLSQPADLLEATNTFKDEKGKDVELSSGIGKAELPVLLDRCTTTNATRLTGLVNLNTAPAGVLAALPGLSGALAESVVSAREGLSDEARKTPAWLFQEGFLGADAFKQVAPFLTTRSYQFHFFVAGYAVPAGTYRAFEVIVDAAVKPARILLLRDVSRLGLPFTPGSSDQGSGWPTTAARAREQPCGACPKSPQRTTFVGNFVENFVGFGRLLDKVFDKSSDKGQESVLFGEPPLRPSQWATRKPSATGGRL